MHSPPGNGVIDSFTLELLRIGYVLVNLASEIAEPAPNGKQTSGETAVEMISGTIRTYLDEVDEGDVRRATELIGGAAERVTEHLELALALRKRMEGLGKGRLFDEPPSDDDGDPVDLRAESYQFPVYRPAAPDVLDELTTELIDCGGVLSQLIGGMVAYHAAGRSAPDADPIPEVAHRLIRGVVRDIRKRHSKRDVTVAARIVHEASEGICNDIFFVDPDYVDPESN